MIRPADHGPAKSPINQTLAKKNQTGSRKWSGFFGACLLLTRRISNRITYCGLPSGKSDLARILLSILDHDELARILHPVLLRTRCNSAKMPCQTALSGPAKPCPFLPCGGPYRPESHPARYPTTGQGRACPSRPAKQPTEPPFQLVPNVVTLLLA